MKKFSVLVTFIFLLLPGFLVGVLRLQHGDFSYWVHPQETRNLKKRLETNYPYICGNVFRNVCDFIFDETTPHLDSAQIKDGDIIFVRNQNDFLDYFFTRYHPNIKAKYILVTHNSICLEGLGKYKKYLDDENIVAWFGKNLVIDHPKASPIPLGIGNRYWWFGKKYCIDKVLKNPSKKDKFLCMNFVIGIQRERRGPIRLRVSNLFKDKSFCYKPGRKSFQSYLIDIARSKFVLSPEGNGIDCHRTWESMLLGSIPIITSSGIDCLFEGLPIIIVNDWIEVTKEFLEQKYKELCNHKYNLEKLYADYWLNKVLDFQKEVKRMYGES